MLPIIAAVMTDAIKMKFISGASHDPENPPTVFDRCGDTAFAKNIRFKHARDVDGLDDKPTRL